MVGGNNIGNEIISNKFEINRDINFPRWPGSYNSVLEEEKKRSESAKKEYKTSILVRINDGLNYSIFDERTIELAEKRFGKLENNKGITPESLLTFQIISEGFNPEEYERDKDNGYLFEIEISYMLYGHSNMNYRFVDVELEHGYLHRFSEEELDRYGLSKEIGIHKSDLGYFQITGVPQSSEGYGFYLDFNSRDPKTVVSGEVDAFKNHIVGFIEQKYSDFVKILSR